MDVTFILMIIWLIALVVYFSYVAYDLKRYAKTIIPMEIDKALGEELEKLEEENTSRKE